MNYHALRSVAVTALVSLAGGTAAYFFKVSFWGTSIALFVAQFIFFYVWNGWQQNKIALQIEQIENDRLAELAKQATIVKCSACQHDNVVFIRLDQDNKFNCEACQKANAVYISIESAQKTTPISPEQTTVSEEIVKKLADEAIQEHESTTKVTKHPDAK